MNTIDFPILIAGAGPTGLTMANLLARFNIPFLLIDQNSHPSRESKAFGIQARSLEIFNQLGFAEKAIEEGATDSFLHLLTKGKEAGKFQIGKTLRGETGFPFFLILPQQTTEALLIKSLEKYGHRVHWEHQLLKLEVHETVLQATVKEASGEEKKINVQYVLGCDGAGSQVREQGRFSFSGKTYSPVFYLADCELEWNNPHGDIYFMFDPRHFSAVFSYREKNRYRIFNFLNTSIEKDQGKLTMEEVQKILDSAQHNNVKVKQVTWSSAFRIHSRLANVFRKGSIFLLGDAAHVHSPAGGQGMNTGIQDAYNLAWKMALVLKGFADAKLLDTYQEERYVIAENLHKTTDRFFDWMIKKHRFADLFRLYVFPPLIKLLFGKKFLRKRVFRRGAQIAIKYRYSSLSRDGTRKGFSKKTPKAGDRAPYVSLSSDGNITDTYQLLNCTHFTLLLAVSDPDDKRAKEFKEFFISNTLLPLVVHVIPRNSGNASFYKEFVVKKEAVFIIRPDSHIGFRSAAIDIKEVCHYFQAILGKNISDKT